MKISLQSTGPNKQVFNFYFMFHLDELVITFTLQLTLKKMSTNQRESTMTWTIGADI